MSVPGTNFYQVNQKDHGSGGRAAQLRKSNYDFDYNTTQFSGR